MWILVVILFIGGQPADSKILSIGTEKDCKEGRKALEATTTATIWLSECIKVEVPKFKKERDS